MSYIRFENITKSFGKNEVLKKVVEKVHCSVVCPVWKQ